MYGTGYVYELMYHKAMLENEYTINKIVQKVFTEFLYNDYICKNEIIIKNVTIRKVPDCEDVIIRFDILVYPRGYKDLIK